MAKRTPQQIKELLENSKANLHQQFEQDGELVISGQVAENNDSKNSALRQSNLIYLGENTLATNEQKNSAADELGRLVMDFKKQDGVWENNLWEGVFA